MRPLPDIRKAKNMRSILIGTAAATALALAAPTGASALPGKAGGFAHIGAPAGHVGLSARLGVGRAGFGRAGFGRAGFGRAGFGGAGFGRAGFNRGFAYRGGFHHGWRGAGAGVGLGLAAGALAGAALAAPYYGYGYYDPGYYAPDYYSVYTAPVAVGPSDAVAYCEARFKSYDPASGTFLGYDGERHPCP